MALSYQHKSPSETTAGFCITYGHWLVLNERYTRLRSISDRISAFPNCITTSSTITSSLEMEIEDLEEMLEEATLHIIRAIASGTSHQIIGAVLHVLEEDIKTRLLLGEDDLALQLVRAARYVSGPNNT